MKKIRIAILFMFTTGTIFAQNNEADAAKAAVEKAVQEAAAAVEDDEIVVEAAQVGRAIMIGGAGTPQLIAVKRFQLTQTFAVEIDEIKTICELDDGQVKKLTVGAKGAVKKLTDEWKKSEGAQLGMVGGIIGEADDDKAVDEADEKVEVEITDAEQIDDMSMQMVVMGVGGNPFVHDQPTENEFWKKTLASVLSESQATKLDLYRAEREIKKRDAMTALCMNTLNVELGLNEEQYGKLTALLAPQMANAKIKCFAFMEPYLYYWHASKIEESSLKEFLSEAQLQKWKIFMAPSKQIGQMMEMEAQKMGAIQVRGQPVEIDDDR